MTQFLTAQTRVRLKALYRMQWEAAQQAHVLLYPEGMITLNESASEILSLCRGQLTIDEMISTLEQKFPQAGSLADDVYDFLTVALNNGWIEHN